MRAGLNTESNLLLNLVYDHEQSQKNEDTIFYRKLIKAVGYTTLGVFIGVLRGIPKEKNTKGTLATFCILATTTIYSIQTIWFCLQLEKEFFFGLYPEQRIAHENRIFKLLKNFLVVSLAVLPATTVTSLSSSSNALQIAMALSLYFCYSLYYMYAYYFFLEQKNNILSVFRNDTARIVEITDAFTEIVNDAIPTLLFLNKAERINVLGTIYGSPIHRNISLPVFLNELKCIKTQSSTDAYISWLKLKKMPMFCLAMVPTIMFTLSDSYMLNLSSVRGVCIPAYIFMNYFISSEVLNRASNFNLRKKPVDIVSRYYPKAFYFISIFACISWGLYVKFSELFPTDNINYYNMSTNKEIIGLYFIKNFFLIHIFSHAVFNALITNSIEIFSDEEKKDMVRLVDFLNHLKQRIFKKARTDIMTDVFQHLEGELLLHDLGITPSKYLASRKGFFSNYSTGSTNSQPEEKSLLEEYNIPEKI